MIMAFVSSNASNTTVIGRAAQDVERVKMIKFLEDYGLCHSAIFNFNSKKTGRSITTRCSDIFLTAVCSLHLFSMDGLHLFSMDELLFFPILYF